MDKKFETKTIMRYESYDLDRAVSSLLSKGWKLQTTLVTPVSWNEFLTEFRATLIKEKK